MNAVLKKQFLGEKICVKHNTSLLSHKTTDQESVSLEWYTQICGT